jgi:hypothetical protein
MIKRAFLVLFTGVSIFATAQTATQENSAASTPASTETTTTTTTSAFKPKAGDISVDFTLINASSNALSKGGSVINTVFDLADDNGNGFGGGLRFRYFLASDLAIRANVIVDLYSHSEFPIESDPLDGLSEEDAASGYHKTKNNHFNVSLGAEKHFKGTKRLDTYAGGELMYNKVSISENFYNMSYNTTTSKYDYDQGYKADATGAKLNEQYSNYDAGNAIGLRLLVGSDFYIAPKIYVGVELGWSLMYKWVDDYKATIIDPDGGTADTNGNRKSITKVITTKDRGTTFNTKSDITGQFRIGFRL